MTDRGEERHNDSVILCEFRPDWPRTCDRCRGVGLVGGHGDQRTCPDCKGSGLPSEEENDG